MSHDEDSRLKRLIGKRIREFRIARGMSRLRLGSEIGVSDHQIMKYEVGHDHVSASTLWKISATLGVPVDFFVESQTVDDATGEPDDAAMPDDAAVLAAFRQIDPPEVRARVARLILTLAERSRSWTGRATDGEQA